MRATYSSLSFRLPFPSRQGHPLCKYCRTRFYGDGELYSHMQTEHYLCHLCQRLHPGRFVYYRGYPELEGHFRASHK